MSKSMFVAALTALSSAPSLAQECVTCWSDKCADSASYLSRCPSKQPIVQPLPDRHHRKKASAKRAFISGGKVAVLEFDNKLTGPAAAIDRVYFSDAVRAAAKRVIPGAFVMTRENVLELMKTNGKKLDDCFGDCEVETGRKLGADYVVSGRLTKVGTRYFLTLRLHAAQSAELLNMAKAMGTSVDKLVDAADSAAERLLLGEHDSGVEDPTTANAVSAGDIAPPPQAAASAPPAVLAPVAIHVTPAATDTARGTTSLPQQIVCPAGQESTPESEGNCCWAGQVWSQDRCLGSPRCPSGFVPQGDGTEGSSQTCARHVEPRPSSLLPIEVAGKEADAHPAIRQSTAAAGIREDSRTGLAWILIPGGAFTIGCVHGDRHCAMDEVPPRVTTIATFWMTRTEIDVDAYRRCVREGSCTAPDSAKDTCNWDRRPDHPVNCLDWNQAYDYCRWAGGFLPTAEEWERAAKSGEPVPYPWGAVSPNPGYARFDSLDGTLPVGSFAKGTTRWGLMDLAGNVAEWTATDYSAYEKEIRGGGWTDEAKDIRTSSRAARKAGYRSDLIGFRCALRDPVALPVR